MCIGGSEVAADQISHRLQLGGIGRAGQLRRVDIAQCPIRKCLGKIAGSSFEVRGIGIGPPLCTFHATSLQPAFPVVGVEVGDVDGVAELMSEDPGKRAGGVARSHVQLDALFIRKRESSKVGA